MADFHSNLDSCGGRFNEEASTKQFMKSLAFEITNELLNRGLITKNVQPSQVEAVIMQILEIGLDTIKQKIHLEKNTFFDTDNNGSLCGCYGKDSVLTTVELEVTCKSCLHCLRVRSEGRGYTLTG